MSISNPGRTTKQFFAPEDASDQAITSYGARSLRRLSATNDKIWATFQVPWDFAAITKAVLKCVGTITKTSVDLDISSIYASDGEANNAHTESDLVTTYDYTGGELFEIDIATILSNLQPGDNVGIQILDALDPGGELYIIGVEFRYA